ncbi:histone deacetylase family protein [Paracraurococcus lichenis]|uniref:Histone deacetylase family protein n=1 Tax=Paracraurococcus lichenis TaxID=3064888 RepID=A0ABT9E5Q5_9PROT|nr:histone deacetylase family protein [Paracraurococcus sp. LOR1-02]MDO9711499.1 histone deacetylase family protein [Paracraurococcus sp. LOR1-02]
MTMPVILPTGHARHDPDAVIGSTAGGRPYFEKPSRVAAFLTAVEAAGLVPRPVGPGQAGAIETVHPEDYRRFLETAFDRWRAAPARAKDVAVRAHAFAVRHADRPSQDIAGQAGWYLAGHGAPVLEHTWLCAVDSAQAAIQAAALVAEGAPRAYALCRPPGHHAYADLAGGFCFLNNAAIAVETLRGRGFGRVAVLDIDVHHGNGTQHIFYERDDVLFVSLHSDPNTLYPFYAGYADETGQGRGQGWTLNLPLPPGSGNAAWLAGLETGIARIAASGAEALVVSLGFDAQAGDPTANQAVDAEAFKVAGRWIADLERPVLLVQEGGYLVEKLAANLSAFLAGFLPADATPSSKDAAR